MILGDCTVINFGSYRKLEFNFSNIGLSLVYGATGSGKSTLQDIVPWILFGVTAKGGNVGEVCSWTSEGTPTYGALEVDLGDKMLLIVRIRGSSNQNDLHWYEGSSSVPREARYMQIEPYRGINLQDTQNKINSILQFSEEEYRIAFCYNEFSRTNTFFTDKAKTRRELFESLSDLSMPIKLAEIIIPLKKKLKINIDKLEVQLVGTNAKIEQSESIMRQTIKADETWDNDKKRSLESLRKSFDAFENKEPTKQLIKKCPSCNRTLDHNTEITYKKLNNPYSIALENKEKETNPHAEAITSLSKEIEKLTVRQTHYKNLLHSDKHEYSALEELNSLSLELRSVLLQQVTSIIEDEINRLLSVYFDGEFSISFTMEPNGLSVKFTKNSYTCEFTQLSKGQRQLLKLCFVVAVMKVAQRKSNKSANLLTFDEALDGLDSNLKIKAYNLFVELSQSHSSVLIVDHTPEFQSLFDNKLKVELIEDFSRIIHE